MRHKNISFLPQNFPLALPEFTHSGGALFLFSRYNIIKKITASNADGRKWRIDMQKKLFTVRVMFILQTDG